MPNTHSLANVGRGKELLLLSSSLDWPLRGNEDYVYCPVLQFPLITLLTNIGVGTQVAP